MSDTSKLIGEGSSFGHYQHYSDQGGPLPPISDDVDWRADYELLRDAVLEHLDPQDDDVAEPEIMRRAIEEAGLLLRALKASVAEGAALSRDQLERLAAGEHWLDVLGVPMEPAVDTVPDYTMPPETVGDVLAGYEELHRAGGGDHVKRCDACSSRFMGTGPLCPECQARFDGGFYICIVCSTTLEGPWLLCPSCRALDNE
jgi:hypothetical protein